MVQQTKGAPTVDIVTDDLGNLRDFCRLNFNSVASTKEALANNLRFTTTDHEARHVVLKSFPIAGCPRCLLESHRGAPCPTPTANDPLPRSGTSQQHSNRSFLPRSASWGTKQQRQSEAGQQPGFDMRHNATDQQDKGAAPLINENRPGTRSFAPRGKSHGLAETSNHPKAAAVDVHRLPTKKVNILDFLKPKTKSKRSAVMDPEPQEQPTLCSGPQDSDDLAAQCSKETEYTSVNNDLMDESTGMDHQHNSVPREHNRDHEAHLALTGAKQSGLETLTMTSAASTDSAELNRDITTPLKINIHIPMDSNSALLPPSDYLTQQADGAQPTILLC
jgi:hypothetical protein